MKCTTLPLEDDQFDLEWEKEFVARLVGKEAEAWKFFVDTYRPRLREAIRKSLSKHRLAPDAQDDIEQKTWMTVFTKIHRFQPKHKDSLFHWLVSIQYNHIRNLNREPDPIEIEESLVESEGELPASLHTDFSVNPEAHLLRDEKRREFMQAFDTAIQTLTPREQEIVVLRLIKKKDVETVAQLYNLQPQTIYQMTSTIKRKLRNYLLASELFLRAKSHQTGKESKTWKQ